MPPRHHAGSPLVICAALTLAAAGAPRPAASPFVDPPPTRPRDALTPPPVLSPSSVESTAGAVADTTRPPIERTLNLDSALALLPTDAAGQVDWGAAIRQTVIKPRRRLPGGDAPPDMTGFAFDFAYQGPAPMFDAVFPHSGHVRWLRCENCHPTIFRYRNTPPTMAAINQGESCGQCHGKVAFPATSCWRCHVAMPAPEGPPARPAKPLGDLVLARRTDSTLTEGGLPRARFAHWVHRIRFDCATCHEELFPMRAGADTLTMDGMRGGKSCGRCHDGASAFGLLECNRCHVPAASGAARKSRP